jgi:hypothetical protein
MVILSPRQVGRAGRKKICGSRQGFAHETELISLPKVLGIKIQGFPKKALRESLIPISEKPYF